MREKFSDLTAFKSKPGQRLRTSRSNALTWRRLQVIHCSRGETMKIAEVSERYGISTDTLRYYERIGLLPAVNRNDNGIRDYNERDLQRVDFIKCMRGAGLPIEVLIDYMALIQQGDLTIEARKEILVEQRDLLGERIQEMQKTLDLLNHKIQVYENAILTKERQIVQIEEV